MDLFVAGSSNWHSQDDYYYGAGGGGTEAMPPLERRIGSGSMRMRDCESDKSRIIEVVDVQPVRGKNVDEEKVAAGQAMGAGAGYDSREGRYAYHCTLTLF